MICLWINNSETAKVIWPPSPTNAQRPQVRTRCRTRRTQAHHRHRRAGRGGGCRSPPRQAGIQRARRRVASLSRAQRRCAADHVTVAALLADTAAGDVVHHNPVPDGEPTTTGTYCHHLAARLVPGDHTSIRLGSTAQVLPIDRADVAAADRRSLHLQQHLPMSRLGDIDLNMLDGAVAGKDDSAHRCHERSLIEIGARTHDCRLAS